VGEVDPLGTRRDGLDTFLDQKVEEGYVLETRTDTHAIISRRPKASDASRAAQILDATWSKSTKVESRRCVRQSRDALKAVSEPPKSGGPRPRLTVSPAPVWRANMATKDKNAKKSMAKKPAQKTLKEKRQAKKAKK
jgi:tRNA G26 N,N-dimethylase Trm1